MLLRTSVTADVTLDLVIEWDYQPPEEPERGPEAQYPGCAEAAEISVVRLGDADITNRLSPADLDQLAEQLLGGLRLEDYEC